MALVGAAMFTSCADNDPLDFQVTKPENLSQYEYLKSYDVLKNYVDAEANPNFILGSAVNAQEYNKKGVVYALTNTNFQDVVTGNAFKNASCMNNSGVMDFTTVKDFVKNATKAGLSVFGHTLVWHSQQSKYLKNLVADANRMLHVYTPEAKANTWDWCVNYELSTPLTVGKTYQITMKAYATSACEFCFWPVDKDNNVQYESAFNIVKANKLLQTNTIEFTTRFPLSKLQFEFGKFGGDLYIDEVTLVEKGSNVNLIENASFDKDDLSHWTKPGWHNLTYQIEGEVATGEPLTPEQKEQKRFADVSKALNDWITGIMNATKGQVKAWDVVNEPIGSNGALQSATRGTAIGSADDIDNNFYWQDYLGDENYVRMAVKDAREAFVNAGGKADELKLFVNDYGLEGSVWDLEQNKLTALINWINVWESDGKTKIDGIGTQMHVSVNMNAAEQKKQEERVAKMFEIMAATGKLVRISELDMGIIDENGNEVKTVDATEEQLKAQAKYFNYIVRTYFEKVPAAQRYSICAWGQTDSPAGSGWRAGMPIGIWDANYNRKHAYAGFADGLAGKEYTAGE